MDSELAQAQITLMEHLVKLMEQTITLQRQTVHELALINQRFAKGDTPIPAELRPITRPHGVDGGNPAA